MENKKDFAKWDISENQLKDITPLKVRDLIIDCFYTAQVQTFRRVKEKIDAPRTEKDMIDSMVRAVKLAFSKCNADFDNPTKESLEQVIKFLADRASTWGTPQDIIEHHMSQIQKAIGRLE